MAVASVHLVILVGTNPLPLWLAWKHLAKEMPRREQAIKRVTLVHTDKTQGEMLRLRAEILKDLASDRFSSLEVPSGEPTVIQERLSRLLRRLQAHDPAALVHLHYTGGTKAMILAASHACREIANAEASEAKASQRRAPSPPSLQVIESYLSPRGGLPSLIDGEGLYYATDARRGITLGLETLAALHGFEIERSRQEPPLAVPLEAILADLNAQGRQRGRKLEQAAYGALCRVLDAHASEDLHTEAWWDLHFRRIEQQTGRLGSFQVDVLGMIGPQLLLISCTTAEERHVVKQKAFEALHRSRQVGGDEAKVIVISGASDEDASSLEDTLRDETGSDEPPLQIWGRMSWDRLDGCFSYALQDLWS